MSETFEEFSYDPIEEMRRLIYGIHLRGFSDIDAMQRFVHLYEAYPLEEEDKSPDEYLKKLDSPEHNFEYWEGMFDEVVWAYDELGGSATRLAFPDIGRNPSDDWNDQVADLIATFQNPDSVFLHSHAAFVAKHIFELLEGVDNFDHVSMLVSNPRFLNAFCDAMRRQDDEFEDMPTEANYAVLAQVSLQALGYINTDTVIQDWSHERKHGEDSTMYMNIESNIKAIARLESARKGSVQVLNQQFGIRHFRRYPTDVLLRQVETKGVASRSYGIIVGAVSDHNGALGEKQDVIEDLATQIAASHDLYITEANSTPEFEFRLKQFHALNHNRHAVDFVLISAHGGSELVQFGLHPALGSLVLTSEFKVPPKLFSLNTTVVLSGCETGRPHGIANKLSQSLNTTVIAPTEAASTRAITTITDKKGLRLIPNFQGENGVVQPAIYRNGQLLNAEHTELYLNIDVVNPISFPKHKY